MIAIVDYHAGNLTSVRLAFDHIGVLCEITSDPNRIVSAERVVFPGVGAAGQAMCNLREMGLLDSLKSVLFAGKPFLGICLGTQVILEFSEEDRGTECIGLVPGTVKRFVAPNATCKIPHMGWNTVEFVRSHPVLEGIEDGTEFYFVHSYYPFPSDESYVIGQTEYAGTRFASIIGKNNLLATQFHPERSGRFGLKVLENFSRWDGNVN